MSQLISIELSEFDAAMIHKIFSEFKDYLDNVNEYVSVSFALNVILDKLEGVGVNIE